MLLVVVVVWKVQVVLAEKVGRARVWVVVEEGAAPQ